MASQSKLWWNCVWFGTLGSWVDAVYISSEEGILATKMQVPNILLVWKGFIIKVKENY